MTAIQTIKNPRITEKATNMLEQNVYTFDVTPSANKTEVKKAVFGLYKVKPVKVNILTVPDKKTLLRGKVSMKDGGKKAVVYLKKGDKIEFV
ncbi:50S ribosomal protein L23 [Candidatus Nomurabacteria bacterium]|nr:50S ribosomal protein L23 [Candidatus Nomurabacteria bacterium]